MTLPRTGRLLTVRLLLWDTQVSKHASVLMLPALPSHPRHVRGPPTMVFASTGDVVLLPSLVVPSLGTTNNDGGGSLYSPVPQQ